jgi:phosphatidylserine/phosphatidylglycerophosphate/cardiolipin synthase-like enzyme
MLRITRFKRAIDSSALLNSKLYDEKSFFDAFARDIGSARHSITIESPYLTERRARQFSRLLKRKVKDGVEVVIYTRNPRHHDKILEVQAWKALEILKSSGVRVFMCDDMRHRKLAIIDDELLWEGSLNIFSQSESCEIMRRTYSENMCIQMKKYIKLGYRRY